MDRDTDDDEVGTHGLDDTEDILYKEELITYKRRDGHIHASNVGDNVRSATKGNEVIIDNEIAPEMDDFSVIEM